VNILGWLDTLKPRSTINPCLRGWITLGKVAVFRAAEIPGTQTVWTSKYLHESGSGLEVRTKYPFVINGSEH